MAIATEAQKSALRAVCALVINAVKDMGAMGAPGGALYAALMTQGCTFSQYQSLMSGLVSAGMVVKRGDCYFTS